MPGPEDVVVVAVMMAVMMAVVPDGPENVVMTTMVSMMTMMPPVMPVMSVMPPVMPVMTVMAMMTSGRPEDVSVTFPPAIFVIFLGGRIFLLFRIHEWMDDVMNIIGDDKHHLLWTVRYRVEVSRDSGGGRKAIAHFEKGRQRKVIKSIWGQLARRDLVFIPRESYRCENWHAVYSDSSCVYDKCNRV